MTKTAVELLALAMLLVIAGGVGWVWRGEQDQAALIVVNKDVATCTAGAQASDAAVAKVQSNQEAQRAQHDGAMQDAQKSIEQRPATVAATVQRAQRRANSIAQSPHDDDDCKALAALPVCAAVADQLWPVQRAPAGGDAPHSD